MVPVCPECKEKGPDGASRAYCPCVYKEEKVVEPHPRTFEGKVDWRLPIKGVNLKNGKEIPVKVDISYHSDEKQTAVNFPCNVWTGGRPQGTWYFNNNGMACGGLMPEGYNGLFVIYNV